MYICLCKGIGEADFSKMLAQHPPCPEAIKRIMGLDESCCGRCEGNLDEMIRSFSSCLTGDSASSYR